MGVVYKARDKMLDRVVAYKTLPHTLRGDTSALESLVREAQTAAKLNHPNIVTVFDVGQEEGVYFMAMEYVEGKTLQQVLKQVKKVNLQSFLNVAKPLCEVVAYAHENRVIHRDIKPSNIILLANRTVKLMDFGLAKVLQDMSIDKTMLRGTPLYMSPEQVLGKDIDHRTDIYSLGCSSTRCSAASRRSTRGTSCTRTCTRRLRRSKRPSRPPGRRGRHADVVPFQGQGRAPRVGAGPGPRAGPGLKHLPRRVSLRYSFSLGNEGRLSGISVWITVTALSCAWGTARSEPAAGCAALQSALRDTGSVWVFRASASLSTSKRET